MGKQGPPKSTRFDSLAAGALGITALAAAIAVVVLLLDKYIKIANGMEPLTTAVVFKSIAFTGILMCATAVLMAASQSLVRKFGRLYEGILRALVTLGSLLLIVGGLCSYFLSGT